MILANKNGWLIAVRLIRKTRSGTHVQPIDSKRSIFVSLRDSTSLLCGSVDDAIAFVKA